MSTKGGGLEVSLETLGDLFVSEKAFLIAVFLGFLAFASLDAPLLDSRGGPPAGKPKTLDELVS